MCGRVEVDASMPMHQYQQRVLLNNGWYANENEKCEKQCRYTYIHNMCKYRLTVCKWVCVCVCGVRDIGKEMMHALLTINGINYNYN